MSQGNPPGPANKGKGGTVLLSSSPFAQPGAPQIPGAAPPPGAPPPAAEGWGAPPPGMAPPGMAPPGMGMMQAPPTGMVPPGMAAGPPAAGGAVPEHTPGQKTQFLGLEQNIGAGVGYFIGLLSLLFIFMEPKHHRFVRFHAFQWLFMAILGTVLSVVVSLPAVIAMVDSKLTELAIVSAILSLAFIPFGIFWLIAAIKAFGGKAWKIPVVGGIAEKMAMKD